MTAHHVVHQTAPSINLGEDSTQRLMLIMTGTQQHIEIPCKMISEIEIGIPEIDEYGPDLTLLLLPICDELGTLKEMKSFWSISENLTVWQNYQFNDKVMLCTIGAPAVYQEVDCTEQYAIRIDSGLFGYFGTYEFSSIFEHSNFEH